MHARDGIAWMLHNGQEGFIFGYRLAKVVDGTLIETVNRVD
jgi:hypothetical protein